MSMRRFKECVDGSGDGKILFQMYLGVRRDQGDRMIERRGGRTDRRASDPGSGEVT